MPEQRDNLAQDRAHILIGLVLERLMRGYPVPNRMEEHMLEAAGLHFPGDRFLVAVVKPLPAPDNGVVYAPAEDEDAQVEVIWSLPGMPGEIAAFLTPMGAAYAANFWEQIAILVCPHQALDKAHAEAQAHALCSRAVEEMYARHGMKLQISLSQMLEGRPRIRTAYQMASDLANYLQVNRVASVSVANGTEAGQLIRGLSTPSLPDTARRFYHAMGAWDFDAAQRNLAQLGRAYLSTDLNALRTLRYFLVGHVRMSLVSMHPVVPQVQQGRVIDLLNRTLDRAEQGPHLMDLSAIPETDTDGMDELSRVFFRQVREVLQPERLSDDDIIQQAASYIRDHFYEPNISLTMVSEMFGMQLSLFSRQFKKLIGEKPIDFLHHARIAAAKSLLQDTERSVSDVAACVGYISDTSFIQAFKRYEDITPGKYREITGHWGEGDTEE